MNEFLDDDVQRKICDLISHNPGLHLSKIAELLNMKISEVEYHLKFLEDKGIIFVIREAGYEQYFLEKRGVKAREKRTIETREKIYALVAQNPGLHLSKIAEMLDMSVPLTDYHLESLQRDGQIAVVKDAKGYYKRYYIAESEIKIQEKRFLEVLRKKIPLKIVLLLLKHSNLQHKDIMKRLRLPSSTLSYHITKLEDSGIIDVNPHGKERGYRLKNKAEIVRILRKYELHIELHLAIDGFKDLWDDLSYQDSLG